MMSRLLLCVPALALLAITAVAKPPDLPQRLKITVDLVANPIQLMGGFDFDFQEAGPDRHTRASFDSNAGLTVLECLDLLVEAGEDLERARKHAKAGEVGEALILVAKINAAVPGSRVAEACDEVVAEVSRRLAMGETFRPAGRGGEQAAEETHDCCPLMGLLGWVMGGKCDACVCTKNGKGVMVDGLLKAAHLAMGDGRVEKARELVRQAHALDAGRVEADPLVYKMHLLPTATTAGGEERSEPAPTPPNQKAAKKPLSRVAPNIPGVCPDFVEAMEQALRATGGK